jgi:acetyl-CoA C-acetyltransferase
MAKKDDDIVIVAAARSPFDVFGGVLREVSSPVLGQWAIQEMLKRTGLKPEQIDEVNLGMCVQMEAGTHTNVIARQALLLAGLPPTTLSITIDRACCAGSTCMQQSWKNLKMGEVEISLVVGLESPSNSPLYIPAKYRFEGFRMGDVKIIDWLYGAGYKMQNPVSVDAGEVAVENGITREMQDEWALRSHKLYFEAYDRGDFKDEIFPVTVPAQGKKPPVVFDMDAGPRRDTTLEKLAKLSTVYGSPTVTAGNAPGVNTGTIGMVIMKRVTAQNLGLPILAELIRVVSTANPPREIAVAPFSAIRKAMQVTGLNLDDFKVIEINEAFAVMPLLSTKLLADGDPVKTEELRKRTNVLGGAVAVGHPVGASGPRIGMQCFDELRRRGGGYGVAAICGGLAQGDAMVFRVDE